MVVNQKKRYWMKIPKDKILHFVGCGLGALISVPMLWRVEVEELLNAETINQ